MQNLRLCLLGLVLGIAGNALSCSIILAETEQTESSEIRFKTEQGEELVVEEEEAFVYLVTPVQINELLKQGDYEELRRVLNLSIASIDTDDEISNLGEYLAQVLILLGGTNYQLGLYSEAEQALKQALTIQEERLDAGPTETATTLSHLANLYMRMRRFDEAESLFQGVVEVREESLGPDHPEVAIILHNLAILNINQGRYQEAVPLLERTVAIQEEKLGPDNSLTVSAREQLESLYQRIGRQ